MGWGWEGGFVGFGGVGGVGWGVLIQRERRREAEMERRER